MPQHSTDNARSTKELNCGDVTGHCGFKAQGTNDADVLQLAMAHAKNEHGLTVTATLVRTAKAAIHDC
jgi:predicted small metal-binding protein